jgi:hypothetical protein
MPRAGRIAALVFALISASWLSGHTRIDSQRHFASTQRYEDTYLVPPPFWLGVFSLGYREALADLLWMRLLVYFGEEVIQKGRTRNLYDYADAVLSLDPYFIRAYRWIAITGAYRPKNRGRVDIDRAVGYLERASALAPDDGLVAWDLGAFYLYELLPLLEDEGERAECKRKAVEQMRVAVLRGAAPSWATLSTATQLERMGRREQQITFLQEAYTRASSAEDRAAIASELAYLKSASFAEAFQRELAHAEDQRARSFPYLDLELFLQVGAKPAYDHLPLLIHGFDPQAAQMQLAGDEPPALDPSATRSDLEEEPHPTGDAGESLGGEPRLH